MSGTGAGLGGTAAQWSSTAPSAQFWDGAQEMADRMATSEQKEVLTALFEGRIGSQQEFDEWWRVCLPLYFLDPAALDEKLDRMRGRVDVANYMMATQIPGFDVRDQLPSVRAPSLVLSGRQNWVTPVSQSVVITEALPDATHVTFEHSGHMSPFRGGETTSTSATSSTSSPHCRPGLRCDRGPTTNNCWETV